MKIFILTNSIPGGWSPTSKFLKGSEECIRLFSESLSNDYSFDVSVFTDLAEDEILEKKIKHNEFKINGVSYFQRKEVYENDPDLLIVWKEINVDFTKVGCGTRVIRWSSDVEDRMDLGFYDAFVNLTKFHNDSNAWVPKEKALTIPHGIDYNLLKDNKVDKEIGTILYSSSPDRGLFTLLQDWGKIKENYPDLKLKITYGTGEIKKFGGNDAHNRFIGQMQHMLNQKDIEYLGCLTEQEMAQEYWKAQYWCLPLLRPQSELFCLAAAKAQYCNATPIVNLVGALKDVIYEYIDYNDFVKKSECQELINKDITTFKEMNWSRVISTYWYPLFEAMELV